MQQTRAATCITLPWDNSPLAAALGTPADKHIAEQLIDSDNSHSAFNCHSSAPSSPGSPPLACDQHAEANPQHPARQYASHTVATANGHTNTSSSFPSRANKRGLNGSDDAHRRLHSIQHHLKKLQRLSVGDDSIQTLMHSLHVGLERLQQQHSTNHKLTASHINNETNHVACGRNPSDAGRNSMVAEADVDDDDQGTQLVAVSNELMLLAEVAEAVAEAQQHKRHKHHHQQDNGASEIAHNHGCVPCVTNGVDLVNDDHYQHDDSPSSSVTSQLVGAADGIATIVPQTTNKQPASSMSDCAEFIVAAAPAAEDTAHDVPIFEAPASFDLVSAASRKVQECCDDQLASSDKLLSSVVMRPQPAHVVTVTDQKPTSYVQLQHAVSSSNQHMPRLLIHCHAATASSLSRDPSSSSSSKEMFPSEDQIQQLVIPPASGGCKQGSALLPASYNSLLYDHPYDCKIGASDQCGSHTSHMHFGTNPVPANTQVLGRALLHNLQAITPPQSDSHAAVPIACNETGSVTAASAAQADAQVAQLALLVEKLQSLHQPNTPTASSASVMNPAAVSAYLPAATPLSQPLLGTTVNGHTAAERVPAVQPYAKFDAGHLSAHVAPARATHKGSAAAAMALLAGSPSALSALMLQDAISRTRALLADLGHHPYGSDAVASHGVMDLMGGPCTSFNSMQQSPSQSVDMQIDSKHHLKPNGLYQHGQSPHQINGLTTNSVLRALGTLCDELGVSSSQKGLTSAAFYPIAASILGALSAVEAELFAPDIGSSQMSQSTQQAMLRSQLASPVTASAAFGYAPSKAPGAMTHLAGHGKYVHLLSGPGCPPPLYSAAVKAPLTSYHHLGLAEDLGMPVLAGRVSNGFTGAHAITHHHGIPLLGHQVSVAVPATAVPLGTFHSQPAGLAKTRTDSHYQNLSPPMRGASPTAQHVMGLSALGGSAPCDDVLEMRLLLSPADRAVQQDVLCHS